MTGNEMGGRGISGRQTDCGGGDWMQLT